MSLSVRDLKLSHFRSHRLARLELDGRPIALFGPNGAGKTNVLEAVSLLSPGRGARRATVEEMARRPEALGWKVAAEVDSQGARHEITTQWEGGAGRSVQIDGKTAAQSALGQLVRVVWLVPAMDRLWIEGAEGRRRFLDRLVLSFEPSHAEAALTYEKAMRERNRLLKDNVRDPHWYTALEGQMAQSGAAMIAARHSTVAHLIAAQEGAATAFPAADLALRGPDGPMPETAEELTEAWAKNRYADFAAGRTLIGPHRVDVEGTYRAKGVSAREASTGEQKALLLSLILANARALTALNGAPPLLLLDEVAAHLDAARRAALYDEICALEAQAWMTGTEATLFDALGPRAQHFEVQDNDGQSTILT